MPDQVARGGHDEPRPEKGLALRLPGPGVGGRGVQGMPVEDELAARVPAPGRRRASLARCRARRAAAHGRPRAARPVRIRRSTCCGGACPRGRGRASAPAGRRGCARAGCGPRAAPAGPARHRRGASSHPTTPGPRRGRRGRPPARRSPGRAPCPGREPGCGGGPQASRLPRAAGAPSGQIQRTAGCRSGANAAANSSPSPPPRTWPVCLVAGRPALADERAAQRRRRDLAGQGAVEVAAVQRVVVDAVAVVVDAVDDDDRVVLADLGGHDVADRIVRV